MTALIIRALALTLLIGMTQGCRSEQNAPAKAINDQPDNPLAAEYMSAMAGATDSRFSPISKLNCKVRIVSAVNGYDISGEEPMRSRVYYVLVHEDGKLLHADSCRGSPSECTSVITDRARETCPEQ